MVSFGQRPRLTKARDRVFGVPCAPSGNGNRIAGETPPHSAKKVARQASFTAPRGALEGTAGRVPVQSPVMTPPEREATCHDATLLLERVEHGDAKAADELLQIVYDELRAIAGSYLRGDRGKHTLQPTALVHEAYLKLVRSSDAEWRDRAHFRAVASTAMRQILINYAEAKRAAKRGGDAKRVAMDDVDTLLGGGAFDLMGLDEALNDLQSIDARQCRLVELLFFGGLEMAQAAQLLDVSQRTAERSWRQARAWMRARLAGELP